MTAAAPFLLTLGVGLAQRLCRSAALAGSLALLAVRPAVASTLADFSSVLVDGEGVVLEESAADRVLPAPGVAQLMVVLLTLEQVDFGLFPIDIAVYPSSEAVALTDGALGLRPAQTYRLEDLLRASIIAGARDATAAIANVICGVAEACPELMRRRAALLEMSDTRFEGADGAMRDESTARDLAALALSLLSYPETLKWSSQRGGMLFDEDAKVLANTNTLLARHRDVDGLQIARGDGVCSVVATAQRDGARLLAVVMAAAGVERCADEALRLVDHGFRTYERVEVVREGDRLRQSIAVVGGNAEYIAPVATASYSFSRRRSDRHEDSLVLRFQLPVRLPAPIEPGAIIGELVVERGGHVVAVIPARSSQRVVRRGLF